MKLIFALATLATVGLGFLAWWTFVVVAFAVGFFVATKPRAVLVGAFAPACGWVLTALVRDVIEQGRLSWRLAQLLHVHFGILTYMILILFVAIPSAAAAYSGFTLRSLRASKLAD